MKFSIIVPVYNVEAYIQRCLTSICQQTLQDYEVIIVNDGSTDQSRKKIMQFMNTCEPRLKARFLLIDKQNGGLSSARNVGAKQAQGDYLYFLDSDDYIDEGLLASVYDELQAYPDLQMVRIPKTLVSETGELRDKDKIYAFHHLPGDEAFLRLRKNRITLETAWTYFIQRSYWQLQHYVFPEGYLHEDLALMPIVIFQADYVSSLNCEESYYYQQREHSIIQEKSYENERRKALDVQHHYVMFLRRDISPLRHQQKAYEQLRQYYAEAVLVKQQMLKGTDRTTYVRFIQENALLKDIKFNSWKNIIKKIHYQIQLK